MLCNSPFYYPWPTTKMIMPPFFPAIISYLTLSFSQGTNQQLLKWLCLLFLSYFFHLNLSFRQGTYTLPFSVTYFDFFAHIGSYCPEHLVSTRWAPAEYPLSTIWAPAEHPLSTHWAPAEHPLSTRWAPAEHLLSIRWAPSEHPLSTR